MSYHINEAPPGYKAGRSREWGEEETPRFSLSPPGSGIGPTATCRLKNVQPTHLRQRVQPIPESEDRFGRTWVRMDSAVRTKARQDARMGRNGRWIGGQLPERPSKIFKRHFRVVPFWEDDMADVIDKVGPEVLLGGSDFPHSEGLAFPSQLVDHLDMLTRLRRSWLCATTVWPLLAAAEHDNNH